MRRGNAILAIIVGVLALIVFAFAIVYYVFTEPMRMAKGLYDTLFGGGTTAQAAQSAVMEPIDCSGAKIPKIYLPDIKQASKVFLKGNEAALLAVLDIESKYRADAISGTGAVGLGQFVADTAIGVQSAGLFRGLTIKVVPRADKVNKTVTEPEKQIFRQTYGIHGSSGIFEGRLQPSPSIFASAYYLKNALKDHGNDLHAAYAEGYNRSKKVQSNGKMEKENAADRVVAVYNKINSDGGCKALKDTPGKLGEDLRKLTTGAF